jgi:hypothetical protein
LCSRTFVAEIQVLSLSCAIPILLRRLNDLFWKVRRCCGRMRRLEWNALSGFYEYECFLYCRGTIEPCLQHSLPLDLATPSVYFFWKEKKVGTSDGLLHGHHLGYNGTKLKARTPQQSSILRRA